MPALCYVFARLSSLTLILVLLLVLQVENQLPERRVTCPPHSYLLAETDLDASVCETRTQAPLPSPASANAFWVRYQRLSVTVTARKQPQTMCKHTGMAEFL